MKNVTKFFCLLFVICNLLIACEKSIEGDENHQVVEEPDSKLDLEEGPISYVKGALYLANPYIIKGVSEDGEIFYNLDSFVSYDFDKDVYVSNLRVEFYSSDKPYEASTYLGEYIVPKSDVERFPRLVEIDSCSFRVSFEDYDFSEGKFVTMRLFADYSIYDESYENEIVDEVSKYISTENLVYDRSHVLDWVGISEYYLGESNLVVAESAYYWIDSYQGYRLETLEPGSYFVNKEFHYQDDIFLHFKDIGWIIYDDALIKAMGWQVFKPDLNIKPIVYHSAFDGFIHNNNFTLRIIYENFAHVGELNNIKVKSYLSDSFMKFSESEIYSVKVMNDIWKSNFYRYAVAGQFSITFEKGLENHSYLNHEIYVTYTVNGKTIEDELVDRVSDKYVERK